MIHDPITSEIRCPVHGFVGLTDLERKIIDQPEFQRLRRIKQLAWTDYVYPGASHSRFEHSLGVMHVAGRLFEAVVGSSEALLKETYGYTEAGLTRAWQIVRLAGLLHDVGHPPFSHATEHLLPYKAIQHYSLFPGEDQPEQFQHEDYSVAIIETIFANLIEQHPLNRRNAKITATEVTALIAKRAPGATSLFWKDIISGQLDADRMDYLLRDSLHAGVSYGKYDLDRIVATVCAVRRPKEESEEPKIAIMKGGAHAAEALIMARYWMHKQVYFHKTRLACNFHLEEAVRNILLQGKAPEDTHAYYPRPDSMEQLKEFLKWDDYKVMGFLVDGQGGEHGKRLMERNHYRLICELTESDSTPQELSDSAARNKAVIEALGLFVKHKTQPKTLWYKTKANDLVLVEDDSKKQIGFLSGYSALMRSINSGSLQFVYADKSEVKTAREAYQAYIRGQSELKKAASVEPLSPSVEPPSPSVEPPPSIEQAQTLDSGQLSLEALPPNQKTVQRSTPAQKGISNAS